MSGLDLMWKLRDFTSTLIESLSVPCTMCMYGTVVLDEVY